MTRILASLSAAALLVAAAQAQCLGAATGTVQVLTPTGGFPDNDEGRTVPAVALGFTFPMAGALPFAPGATHAFLESNGELYLTNATYGIFAPVGPSIYGINSIGEWRGGANGSPRIAPWGGDSEAGNGAAWGIYLDTSVAGQATIYWNDIWEYTGGFPVGSHNVACTLYSTGVIEFSYGPQGTFPTFPFHSVGVSIGNNVGTGTEVSQDLSAGIDSGALGLLFEDFFTTAPDLEAKRLTLTPNGLGGFVSSVTCAAAFHAQYGVGCYDYVGPPTQAVYEYNATPALTQASFNGQSMVATPTLNGYSFSWGGGTYVAPTIGATTLVLTDDSEVDVTPSVAFPHVGGPVATLSVCSNGYVNMGPIGNNSVFSYGSVFNLLNSPIAAFRTNSDYDPGSSPGAIKTEEVGGILYITWENIERWNTAGADDTWQFQLNLTTGVVTYVWSVMQGTLGGGTVVGYAPGVSNDPGSVVLSTALPIVTSPDVNLTALALSASPAPVFTIGGPTVPVTYQIDNAIDVLPPFGLGINLLIFSFLPFPGGFDMTFLGIDFCNLNVLSLDIVLTPSGTAPTSTLTLAIPQPLFPGFSLYSQAVSLFTPNSLPNGLNPFGAILSNGLQSYFNTF